MRGSSELYLRRARTRSDLSLPRSNSLETVVGAGSEADLAVDGVRVSGRDGWWECWWGGEEERWREELFYSDAALPHLIITLGRV
jgi:hypothetical protein